MATLPTMPLYCPGITSTHNSQTECRLSFFRLFKMKIYLFRSYSLEHQGNISNNNGRETDTNILGFKTHHKYKPYFKMEPLQDKTLKLYDSQHEIHITYYVKCSPLGLVAGLCNVLK